MIQVNRASKPSGPFRVSITKTGNNAESAYIDTTGMLRPGVNNFPWEIHTEGSDVEVAYTMADSAQATHANAAANTGIHWEVVGTVAADSSLQQEFLGTAIRLSFTAPATVTLGAM